MTKKNEVNLDTYKKEPRRLTNNMLNALEPGGVLNPLLAAVAQDDRLRLEIRDCRFNIYYSGGSLLRVAGSQSGWEMHFDAKYFKDGSTELPHLRTHSSTAEDSRVWVEAFPALIAGMDNWWIRNPKIERAHCQAMSAANSAYYGLPSADYLIIDLEYQWAQRRFDLMAAKRKPTIDDPSGWVKPDLVFVEVKSDYGACTGASGLGDHVRDFYEIITARSGERIPDIKLEFENLIAQKRRLGLLHSSLPFKPFSTSVPELLIVLVDLDLGYPSIQAQLEEIRIVSNKIGNTSQIQFMCLDSTNYRMTSDKRVPLERLKNQ